MTAAVKADTPGNYSADAMSVLEGLDPIRKRPGMYIGSTDSRGLNHCAYEIVDNSVDEAIAGFCTRIEVTLHPDGSVEVVDDGRGIPVDINSQTGLSGLELALARIHGGGKFGAKNGGYATGSGGLHGVGSAAVNALSLRLDAKVWRGGKVHEMSFERGVPGLFAQPGPLGKFVPNNAVQVTGKATPAKRTGTSIRYWLDTAFFEPDAVFSADLLRAKLRDTAFLVPGLSLTFRDARDGDVTAETFHFPDGLKDMVDREAPAGDRPVSDTLVFAGEGSYKENAADELGVMRTGVERTCQVEVSLRWGTGYDTTAKFYTNVIPNADGGAHKVGLERALAATMIDAVQNATPRLLRKGDEVPILEDVLEGITAVTHVRVPEPKFTSQTKDKLSTTGVTKAVQTVVTDGLKRWMTDRKTKAQARIVLEKIVAASRVRLEQKAQKETARRKTALEGSAMPPKLADCRSTGVAQSELFLVEGDSAGGSAKKGRSAEFQAILPLRGKPLNVQKASLTDALKNQEIASIIQVLGAGSGRSFDLDAMRYGRVVIMADADVDGSHIRTLLITLFMRYMRPVIESGRLFAAMPPLFQVTSKGRNPETRLAYTQADLDAIVTEWGRAGREVATPIKRFKGLGEMNAEDLWATTMDPAVRSVRRITMDDAEKAEALLDLLMGDRVEPRKAWLTEFSTRVDAGALDA